MSSIKPSDGRLSIRPPQHGERCAAVIVKDFAELAYITREEPPRVQFLGYPWLSAAELREIADALDARACAKIDGTGKRPQSEAFTCFSGLSA